jgi:hypothetical protein
VNAVAESVSKRGAHVIKSDYFKLLRCYIFNFVNLWQEKWRGVGVGGWEDETKYSFKSPINLEYKE